jgi:hypothetical protein
VHTRLYLDSAGGNTDGAGQADRPRPAMPSREYAIKSGSEIRVLRYLPTHL